MWQSECKTGHVHRKRPIAEPTVVKLNESTGDLVQDWSGHWSVADEPHGKQGHQPGPPNLLEEPRVVGVVVVSKVDDTVLVNRRIFDQKIQGFVSVGSSFHSPFCRGFWNCCLIAWTYFFKIQFKIVFMSEEKSTVWTIYLGQLTIFLDLLVFIKKIRPLYYVKPLISLLMNHISGLFGVTFI